MSIVRPGVLAFLLVVAGCGGRSTSEPSTTSPTTVPTTSTSTTTTPSSTTTTIDPAVLAAEELEADASLIRRALSDLSDSWFSGLDAGVAATVAINHPDLGYAADGFSCMLTYPDGWAEEMRLVLGSVARADGWVLPPTGTVPTGRLYVLQVEITTGVVGGDQQTSRSEIHAAVLDGEVKLFLLPPLSC